MTTASTTPRWRTITFWVLLALLLFLHLGERPEILAYPVTAFGGVDGGHEVHFFALGVATWVAVIGIVANLRHPARQVGAAWMYTLVSVFAFAMVLALADLPAEILPIVAAAVVVGLAAFVVHPATMRDKIRPVQRPSALLLALLALAAVPLVVYAVGQLDVHAGSGPHDEHFEFGHWIVMAVYALTVLPIGLAGALKVSGWRLPAWAAGAMVALLGVASLGMSAVSRLSTPWALSAIAWGVAFIAVAEREARRGDLAQAPVRRTTTAA